MKFMWRSCLQSLIGHLSHQMRFLVLLIPKGIDLFFRALLKWLIVLLGSILVLGQLNRTPRSRRQHSLVSSHLMGVEIARIKVLLGPQVLWVGVELSLRGNKFSTRIYLCPCMELNIQISLTRIWRNWDSLSKFKIRVYKCQCSQMIANHCCWRSLKR